MSSTDSPLRRLALVFATASALAVTLLWATPSQAQIKEPGNHPDYSVELEPHLLLQWSSGFYGSEGYGLGARASIPFLKNGPIPKINNNMAIGFGLDWAHFSGNCWGWGNYYYRNGPVPGDQCSGNDFWVPIVLQWNFFLTPVISVFGEPGLAIEHQSFDYPYFVNCPNGACRDTYSHTDLEPVFFAGARFLFSDTVGATVRLGWPYISAGISILL